MLLKPKCIADLANIPLTERIPTASGTAITKAHCLFCGRELTSVMHEDEANKQILFTVEPCSCQMSKAAQAHNRIYELLKQEQQALFAEETNEENLRDYISHYPLLATYQMKIFYLAKAKELVVLHNKRYGLTPAAKEQAEVYGWI